MFKGKNLPLIINGFAAGVLVSLANFSIPAVVAWCVLAITIVWFGSENKKD